MGKKILILNQGNSNNYGDIAINKVISTYLKKNDFKVKNEMFWSENEVFGTKFLKYPKIIRWFLWNFSFGMDFFNRISIKKKLKKDDYDYILIGGGELLGLNYGFNSSLYLWTKIAKKKNIPIIIYGVSGSDNMRKMKLLRNKKSLKRCDLVCVRDYYTQKICKDIYNIDCVYSPDVVFAYKLLFDKTYTNNYENKNSILIAPIMYYKAISKGLNLKNEDEYIQHLYDKLMYETKKLKCNEIIVTCTDKDDEVISKKLFNYIKDKNNLLNNVYFEKFTNIDGYVELLKKSKLVISGRMHAMILGKIYNCKVVPIKFKDKLAVFEKEYRFLKEIDKIELSAYNNLNKILEIIKKD